MVSTSVLPALPPMLSVYWPRLIPTDAALPARTFCMSSGDRSVQSHGA